MNYESQIEFDKIKELWANLAVTTTPACAIFILQHSPLQLHLTYMFLLKFIFVQYNGKIIFCQGKMKFNTPLAVDFAPRNTPLNRLFRQRAIRQFLCIAI